MIVGEIIESIYLPYRLNRVQQVACEHSTHIRRGVEQAHSFEARTVSTSDHGQMSLPDADGHDWVQDGQGETPNFVESAQSLRYDDKLQKCQTFHP